MPSDPPGELALRPAVAADLPALAEVFVAAREAAVPAMPPLVGGREGARGHVLGLDLERPDQEVWVAELGGVVVGFLRLHGAWVDDLYVLPAHAGAGIGSALLDVARARRPDGFCLWVFASNEPARRFYARHGLVELEATDGSANMERSPDVRLAWPGRDPLAFLRGLVDGVDDELGDLLARRVALTREIQRCKGGGEGADRPARDPEREREVARRLAARAPELGEERLARLVDVLVAESLAAVAPSVTERLSVRPASLGPDVT